MEGRIDAVVIGVGSAGTFTGVARCFKKKHPGVLAVAVETQGSILQGGPPGPHKVEGIGVSFIPANFDRSVTDRIIMVSDDDAFATVKQLARVEGVLAGSSSGANVFAALEIAKELGPERSARDYGGAGFGRAIFVEGDTGLAAPWRKLGIQLPAASFLLPVKTPCSGCVVWCIKRKSVGHCV